MKGILIKNVRLNGLLKDILIKNDTIFKIEECGIINTSDQEHIEIIEGGEKTIIPGFINMHTHSAMTLMRGVKEDMPLHDWLSAIWRIEAKLDDELIYWGTKLAALEMIKTGTTCFNDQYWKVNHSVNAVKEMGLRSLQNAVLLDLFNPDKAEEYKKEAIMSHENSKRWSPLNMFGLTIHSPYTVSEEMILWTSEYAKKYDIKLSIHLAETQKEYNDSFEKHNLSPVAYLHKLGVLDKNVTAAHCVWLSEQDIELLAYNNVNVVHNINSNLKLSSGYKFKYNELRDAGVNVCIGTDGTASSNNLDMLEAMKTTALLQKGWREDPTALPLNELMDMATVNGAKALGINSGKVEEGMLADILLIDTNNYAFTPNFNFTANLVYSANSSCIDTVICNGKILMQNRVVEGEEEILEQVNKLYTKLI